MARGQNLLSRPRKREQPIIMVLRGKKILLGVSGSIAAYKSAWVVREFIKAGAEVRVVLSPASLDFVTPLTLSTLSGNEVYVHFTQPEKETAVWTNHVDLGLWADLMVIAPATANTLSKMARAQSDNLLLATYLSAKCPVYFAPAMDLDMYRHPANQANIQQLVDNGNHFIQPGVGELASGLSGEGRMAEPEEIRSFIERHIQSGLPLIGKRIMVNAGPTYEPIDAVRFIGNHSSGKMGVAIARAALEAGANVTLVLGPTQYPHDLTGMDVIRVTTAGEMAQASKKAFEQADWGIFSAAVADYRPENPATHKMKKQGEALNIRLVPTLDILSHLADSRKPNQKIIGFALETQNGVAYAKDKLRRKNLDAIVLNSLEDSGAGFGYDTNKVSVFFADQSAVDFPLQSKSDTAIAIIEELVRKFGK
jgi:phosphopantothenoylcysteine decarboxylase/phosphopantothenate--cysteine ligase